MSDAPNIDALIATAAQQYGVPAPLLKSVGIAESGLNPGTGNSLSPPSAGTEVGTGMMQLTPSTAKAMGVDPSDPAQAVAGAAKYLRQGYDATGNWDDAARYYYGGPDTSKWGPKTAAYHDKILSTAQAITGGDQGAAPSAQPANAPQPSGPANPFLAMASGADPASGQGGTPTVANPFLDMARNAKAAADAGAATSTGDPTTQVPPPGAGVGSRGSGASVGDRGAMVSGDNVPQGAGTGAGGFLAGISDPVTNYLVNGVPVTSTLRDQGAGVLSGLATIPETMMKGAGGVVRAVGADKSADTLDRWADNLKGGIDSLASDPSSAEFRSRELGGMVLGSEPLTGIKLLGEGAEAKGLAATLRRLGNMSAQGGAAGALTSRGDNVGTNAAIGALAAPVIGGTIDAALPLAMKVGTKGGKIASALRDMLGGDAGAVAGDAAGDAAGTIHPVGRPDIHFDPETMAAFRKSYPELQNLSDQQFADWYGKTRNLTAAQVDGSAAVPAPAAQQTIRTGAQLAQPPAPEGAGATVATIQPADAVAQRELELRYAAALRGEPAPSTSAGPDTAAAQPGAMPSEAPTGPAQPTVTTPPNPATAAAASGDQQALAEALRNAGNPTSADAQMPIAANDLGSRGSRIGLEANTDLPPEVAQHAQALIADGLPRDQAIREAEITSVGAKPTLADVTRSPGDQRGKWEGAKADTPEGQALATQIASNNAALHDTAQKLVQSYGGAPAEGEVASGAAHALATDEDALRRGYSNRYAEAEAAEGPARVAPDDLYAFLNNPYHSGAINRQASGMVAGLRKRLDLFTHNTGAARQRLTPLNAHALEHLRKTAIDAYDEVGSPELRSIIHDWTNLIDKHLTDLGDVGPTYARARHAFATYAGLYKDPEGLAALIRRNDKGQFVNADKWRLAEQKFLGGSNDRTALQVINRLRDLPDNAGRPVLDRLKARIVQDAYESATGRRAGNAADMLGNSLFSGKLFLSRLDQVGMPKLQALFTPQELGRLAVIGRAASHVNEAVPGTVNTSGTSAALLNALSKMKAPEKAGIGAKLGKGVAHLVLGHVTGGAGNIALEGISHAVGVAKSAGARAELAEQLKRAADPVVARTAHRAEAAALADKLRRAAAAHALSDRTAPVAAITQERNR